MSFNLPIITIEVQHMRQAIAHAFTQQQLDYSKEFQIALDKALDPKHVQYQVDEHVCRMVGESINNAVKEFFLKNEEYRSLVEAEVDKRLMAILRQKRKASKKSKGEPSHEAHEGRL